MFELRLKNRKELILPVNDIDLYVDVVPHLDHDLSDWTQCIRVFSLTLIICKYILNLMFIE